jgi:hypothetical protein
MRKSPTRGVLVSWRMKANIIESCSCALVCPCIWGPAKPDQEWCSGVFAITIAEGESEGVDLGGARMLLHFELPGDFVSGIDKAKLYVDTSTSEDQRREIDAIFHGERGGLWEGMKEAIGQWLPTQVTKVTIDHGESPNAQGTRFSDPDMRAWESLGEATMCTAEWAA